MVTGAVRALLRLMCKDDPQAMKALERLEITAADDAVTVELRSPPEEMGALFWPVWDAIHGRGDQRGRGIQDETPQHDRTSQRKWK